MRRSICTAILYFLLGLIPQSAQTQEPVAAPPIMQPPRAQAVEQIAEIGAGLVEKLQSAAQGDRAATQALINDYLVPAAMALILIFVGYLLASFVGRVVAATVSRRVDRTIGRFSGKISHYSIMALVVITALDRFGINVTSFAAILAAGGFAVGIALQGALSNFASGIMLLIFRPFQVDDYIKTGEAEGIVEEIDLFSTRINMIDNRHIVVPNGRLFGEIMINYTRNPVRRVDVKVGVSYVADIRSTRRVLEEAVNDVRGAAHSPPPEVRIVELGDSAVQWECRVWGNPREYWLIREQVVEAVKTNLDRAGITIAYPQIDVHVGGKLLAKAA
jgi:small conductance mechanosensitive channel